MCGFSGFYSRCENEIDYEQQLKAMSDAILHRGPDDVGLWFDKDQGIGLSHRRLAIVDLSPAGFQPMESHSNRYILAFNGEIYNHQELRSELDPQNLYQWKGHSDTETLLECIEAWGLKKTLEQCSGMFAIALWDKEEEKLCLARDRFGEKPLYYGWHNDTLLFGSELKSLKVHSSFNKIIDRNSLALFLRYNYIPTPYSIWENTFKLKPGVIKEFDLAKNNEKEVIYWSFNRQAEKAIVSRRDNTLDESVEIVESTLKSAIEKQMLADVPLGAFLSGGIDSSLIVSLMQELSEKPVKTFSIGFHDKKYNEAEHAKAIARYLGTEHTELYVTAEDAMKVIELLPTMYDEPFADSSAIPTYLVSKIAKSKVTVVLSGDSGDEVFCGYNRYIMTHSLWGKLKFVPKIMRKLIAKAIVSVPPHLWDKVLKVLCIITRRQPLAYFGDKLHKAAGVLDSSCVGELYLRLVSLWQSPESVVLDGKEPTTVIADESQQLNTKCDIERMMAIDTLSYMQDDILVKVDRAAMATSLETRVPFLDHHVVEQAWRIPLEQKVSNGKSKWVLRNILYKYVPKELIERPKMGFGIPLDVWLRGPLKEWAESLLDPVKLKEQGYFCTEEVEKKWQEHQSGKRNWAHHLWVVLMFQMWLSQQEL